MPAAAIQR